MQKEPTAGTQVGGWLGLGLIIGAGIGVAISSLAVGVRDRRGAGRSYERICKTEELSERRQQLLAPPAYPISFP